MNVTDDWRKYCLGDLVVVQGGFAFKSDIFFDDGIPIIRMSDLNDGHLNLDGSVRIKPSKLKALSNFELHTGDFLVGMSGSIGNFAIVREQDLPAYVNQRVGRFRLKAENLADYNFITQVARSRPYKLHIELLAAGAAQLNISPSQIESYCFDLPPKLEQTKIAEILSTVDRAIEQTEALIAKQQRIKTGLMQDLLTRGIDEHGNLRSEQTHKFKDSPLGRIPVDWEVKSFGEILISNGGIIQTGPFGSQLHSYEYMSEGVPVVMPQDINSKGISTANIARITEKKSQSLKRHRMMPGDLVFARRGDLSRCAVIGEKERGWLCGTGCLLMRSPTKVLSPRWTADTYRFYTSQLQVGVKAVGSTMPNLNTGILSDINVALPSIEEQIRIESQLQAVDCDEVAVENRLHKLQALKTALMHDLLTGNKRVTTLLRNKEINIRRLEV